MGNRAVIAFKSMPSIGIYLHWNGGPESVLAFLEETKQRGARSPGVGGDCTYAFARLVQTIADYFTQGGSEPNYELSLGVGPLNQLDTKNGDNGTYWIGEDWEIIGRDHAPCPYLAPLTVGELSKVGPSKGNGDGFYASPFERYKTILNACVDTRCSSKA